MDRKQIETKLQNYISKNRLKSTTQRDSIVETFLGMNGQHVTIEQMLAEVRKVQPGIGYATVYRTLMLLVDAGVANQRHFTEGQSLFELATDEHHDHLICTACGKIIEFENEDIEKRQESVAKSYNFVLEGHRMELYGVCEGMKQKGVCNYPKKN